MLLKELQNYNRKLFLCPPQKSAEAHPTFLKLHFCTSEQMSTYGKLNLLLIKSIWSSLLEKGKEDSYRSKYTTNFLTLPEKKRLTNL